MPPPPYQDKEELDRFCDAMIAIRAEIAEVESGAQPQEGNVLKNAPHTAAVVMADTWDRPYSRAKAAYPQAGLRATKFWPTTSRVNDTYGDRNLVRARPMRMRQMGHAYVHPRTSRPRGTGVLVPAPRDVRREGGHARGGDVNGQGSIDKYTWRHHKMT